MSALFAAASVAFVCGGAFAQQKVTKAQLVGTWSLVSCTGANAAAATPAVCVNPNGRMVMDASGRYILVMAAKGRPKFVRTATRVGRSADEYKAVAEGFAANYGTWTFNEADQSAVAHVEVAMVPNNEGRDGNKLAVSITGDQLTLTGPNGGKQIWRHMR
jgi:hypothetical protein